MATADRGEPLWTMTRHGQRLRCELRTLHDGVSYVQLILNGEFISGWRATDAAAAHQRSATFRREREREGWSVLSSGASPSGGWQDRRHVSSQSRAGERQPTQKV